MKKVVKKTSTRLIVAVVVTLAFLALAAPALAATTVTGAGATFPLPLYQKWAAMYHAKVPTVQVSYNGGGSSFGIAQIEAGNVNFGGTDASLTRAELNAKGLMQFPTCVGGVVPIIHVQGVASGELKLTGTVLANIYLGKITKWNATAIKTLNPGVKLPDAAIAVVHRSDGSGTTFIFTSYLSAISSTWKSQVGASKEPSWPVGIGGNGNPGVATLVQNTSNSIGYVEFAYAKQNHIPYAKMKNRAGAWVLPSATGFAAAASGATWGWKNGFSDVLVNQPGTTSWPITGATFVLVKRQQKSRAFGRMMLRFFDYCYRNTSARKAALKLDYVPMPLTVATKVEAVWKTTVKSGTTPCWP